jgi:hypothetical protein
VPGAFLILCSLALAHGPGLAASGLTKVPSSEDHHHHSDKQDVDYTTFDVSSSFVGEGESFTTTARSSLLVQHNSKLLLIS